MKKLLLLVAGGVGYVLGTRAGRERYEQMRAAYDKVKNDPRVQEKTQQATDLAKEKLGEAASVATEKVKSAAGGSDDVGDQLNPDSLHFQKESGLTGGDLP
jgi:hypothetical protein